MASKMEKTTPRPVGQLGKVEFPIGISSALTVLVIAAGLIFWYFPRLHDILTFLGTGFAMAAGVIAAYYIGKTLQITVNQRDEGLNADKVNKAFSFIQRWNTAPLEERKQWWKLLQSMRSKTSPEIDDLLKEGENRTMVVEVLNFLEEMSLAINEGLADEATLIKFFRTILEGYYSLLADWINKQRTDRTHARPRVFVQFEEVAKRWQKL
jgi:Domain of unknown function (DUF4760)